MFAAKDLGEKHHTRLPGMVKTCAGWSQKPRGIRCPKHVRLTEFRALAIIRQFDLIEEHSKKNISNKFISIVQLKSSKFQGRNLVPPGASLRAEEY